MNIKILIKDIKLFIKCIKLYIKRIKIYFICKMMIFLYIFITKITQR